MISLCFVIFSSKGDDDRAEKQQDCVESCEEDSQKRLGDHCYYWSTARKTWDESELFCKSRNGHLAAVTSLKIHNFLFKKVDKNDRETWLWIGGSDRGQERKWKWTDGSVWNFTNWADQPYKQPSNGRRQDCLQIYHHTYAKNGWNDQQCSFHFLFICSWKICPGMTFLKKREKYLYCSLTEIFSALTTLPPNTTDETVPDSTDNHVFDINGVKGIHTVQTRLFKISLAFPE